jgi:hypothetical protein
MTTEIVKTSSHIEGRESVLSDDGLTYTVITLFANKQEFIAHKYELMATDTEIFVNRNSYCLENNIVVVREWSSEDGLRHLVDNSNFNKVGHLFFNINGINSTEGDEPCLVTFDIDPIDGIMPILDYTYTVLCDVNPSYSGTFTCTNITPTTITLRYPTNPGEYLDNNEQFENALARITMILPAQTV